MNRRTKPATLTTFCLILLASRVSFGQTITDIEEAPDGGIILHWESEPNTIYRIDYATEFAFPTVWQQLYLEYPSHGTSTFWKDVGNENIYPVAPHPRDAFDRFYRVVATDANSDSAPQVNVTSPAAGSVLSGNVTVQLSVNSVLPVDVTRVFVDGGEAAFDGYAATSFVLNTCQFPNGARKLFAVADNSSGSETTDTMDQTSDLIQNFVASSPVYTVSFDNLISEFSASSSFIDPATGGNIRFRAQFAANVHWTLTLTSQAGVAVRTLVGTGPAMEFDWDGTGDGAVSLPPDAYDATLTANVVSASSVSATAHKNQEANDGPPFLGITPDGGVAGFSRDDATSSQGLHMTHRRRSRPLESLPPPPTSQTTTLTPTIILGLRGTLAVGIQTHHPKVAFPPSMAPSDGRGGLIRLNANAPGGFGTLKSLNKVRNGFVFVLGRNGFRLVYDAYDDHMKASDLRSPTYGGTSEFNNANLGLLAGHGVYGMNGDFTISASGPRQTYYPVYKTGDNFYDWVRISQCDFGSSNLRWMGILSCNNLFPDVYSDMYDKEALPINDSLHLLLGCATTSYMVSQFGINYGNALTGTVPSLTPRLTIKEAWFFAARRTQGVQPGSIRHTVVFRVAGWPNNFNDDLVNYQAPASGNPADITFEDSQVYP